MLSVTITGDNPISLADAKSHLRVAHTDDDTSIESLINSAFDEVERLTGRLFRTATCVLTCRSFPDDHLVLPRSPLVSLTSVSYRDTAGESQTLSNCLIDSGIPAAIEPATGTTWPATQDRPDALTVTFTAGGTMPDSIRLAVLLLVDMEYHEAEPAKAARINRRVESLCRPFFLRSDELIGIRE